ncbi:unnamed protein product [Linum trigynum]|uniref:Uncharacterized protein n=1 Tax=Linum trigynum TaxID=586398 RepID=A0AAV2FY78_9ROSI
MSRLLDEDQDDADHMTLISDHDLKTKFMKMAEYAVTKHNRKVPKSETLKLVSLDRGYYDNDVGTDWITFDLHITVSSAHPDQIKYKAVVDAGVGIGEPDHQYVLTSFTRL